MPGRGSVAYPKLLNGRTRREERAHKRAMTEANWRRVCVTVDRRDGRHCRVCETPVGGLTLLTRLERHHLIPVSRGGADESWNVATLCKRCHDERHLKGTLQLSGNADERNELGKLAGIKVERLTESGWQVEKFV